MAGVDAQTGRPIEGDARIVQSIRRLVKTGGDLVLRRHLANGVPDVIGAPNDGVIALAYCANLAGIIADGEKRCDLKTIRFMDPSEIVETDTGELAADGQAFLFIEAVSTETGNTLDLTEPVR